MSRRIPASIAFAVASLAFSLLAPAANPTATLDIDVNKPGPTIPPTFYGLMTEEINHSYDGGLYAELIQNRTFQDNAKDPVHWTLVQDQGGSATMSMDRSDPVNTALPVSLRLDLKGARAAIANDGFWGIPLRPDTTYKVSFYAKAAGGFSGPVTASLQPDNASAPVASADSQPITSEWKKYSLTLTTGHDLTPAANAKFLLAANGTGSVSFSNVSLFPPTYEDAPNGLRPDLMKLMADMHPAFIRLPGGNYVEGSNFPDRFDWKKMIGPVDQRPGHMGCWSYRSSDGFGMPEYLLWCKQLHAEPVLALFAGYTLNRDHVNAGPELQKYVDEALEEIEYVSGPADSTWGKRRAADGITDPLPLHYVEVGNEDFFDRSGSYDGRFAQFFDAIRAKYPNLKIIATTPVKSRKPDLVDDHYYRSARAMATDWRHYDKTDRNGPQIFVGEWASEEGRPTPDLNAALGDSAWLMGLERNADLIPMECYAPLLVNVNPHAWQWGTNLIGYDALRSFGSPSYYAQAIFGQHRGDVVLPANLALTSEAPVASQPAPHGGIGIGTWHTDADFKDISVTHNGQSLLSPDAATNLKDWHSRGGRWHVKDGALASAGGDAETWLTLANPSWTDYTLHLKARKNSGNEGFLILFHVLDRDNYRWVNIGGWGNTHTRMEATNDGGHQPFGPDSKLTIETGKWYDIRVELAGEHVTVFVDDQKIIDATDKPEPPAHPLYASASYSNAEKQLIVKVVNFSDTPYDATLNLHGAANLASDAKAIVLTGNPKDVNTVDEPTKVAPKEESLSNVSTSFPHTFPAHSLTVLLVPATQEK